MHISLPCLKGFHFKMLPKPVRGVTVEREEQLNANVLFVGMHYFYWFFILSIFPATYSLYLSVKYDETR